MLVQHVPRGGTCNDVLLGTAGSTHTFYTMFFPSSVIGVMMNTCWKLYKWTVDIMRVRMCVCVCVCVCDRVIKQ